MSSDAKASPCGSIPPAPRPSQDGGIRDSVEETSLDAGIIPPIDQLDIFQLSPKAALKLFTLAVNATICDESKTRAPPTPPVSSPTTPNNSSFHDRAALALDGSKDVPQSGRLDSNEIPRHHQTPIGSPEAHPNEIINIQPPHLEIDQDYDDYEKQCLAMARAFYSKKPPDIGLEEYLKRIHVYCAMSTGVYLAAACYIQKLTGMLWAVSPSDEERDPADATYLNITPRSVHRIALAALRLAHKALEDNTWAHKRFAGVGGVPNSNLTKLEIAMSYLLDFKLYCPNAELSYAARSMIENNPEVYCTES